MIYSNDILKKFVSGLKIENLADSTIKSYIIDLNMFFEFIIEFFELNIGVKDVNIFVLSKVDKNSIETFIVYLAVYRNCGSARRDRVLASIKKFFYWLYQKYGNVLKNKNNPAQFIPCCQKTMVVPKYLELKKALEVQNVFNERNSKNAERDNCIIVMFLNTGIRLSELVNINISDINFDECKMIVIGKGNKERTVFLNNKVIKAINKYLDTRNDDCSALFVTSTCKRISRRTVQYLCKKAYIELGLEKYNYTTHTLRHTAATYTYIKTQDILLVKEVLGHNSISSTEIYLHVDNEAVRKATESNPLANFEA